MQEEINPFGGKTKQTKPQALSLGVWLVGWREGELNTPAGTKPHTKGSDARSS